MRNVFRSKALIRALVCLAVCLAAVFAVNGALAEHLTSGDWEYDVLEDNTVSIAGYQGTDTSVIVPDEIEGYAVTRIGAEAFMNNTGLVEIDLPASVTVIGDMAFYGCVALDNNGEPLNLPASLTSIGELAFYDTALADIVISSDNGISDIGGYAFYCSTDPEKPSVYVDCHINIIGESAFESGSVYLRKDDLIFSSYPGSATAYANPFSSSAKTLCYAQQACDGVLNGFIDIENPRWTYLWIDPANYNPYDEDFTGITNDDGGTELLIALKYEESGFQSVAVLEGVNALGIKGGEPVFAAGTAVNEVTLPQSLRILGDDALKNTAIEEITLPSGLKRIGERAVPQELESITVPASVDHIAIDAFGAMTVRLLGEDTLLEGAIAPLTSEIRASALSETAKQVSRYYMYFRPLDNEIWGYRWFKNGTDPDPYYVNGRLVTNQNGGTDLLAAVRYFANDIASLEIPEGVNILYENLFYGHTEITSVSMCDELRWIGAYAFDGAENLSGKLTVPHDVEVICEYAFQNCKNLTDIQLSDSLEVLEQYSFNGCLSVPDIELPDNLSSVGQYVLGNVAGDRTFAVKLDSTTSKNLGSSGYPFFYDKDDPDRRYGYRYLSGYYNGLELNGYEVVKFFGSEENIGIDSRVVSIGSEAFRGNSVIKSVVLPNDLINIGQSAFANCNSLTEIDIPQTVRYISGYAFNCTPIAEVTLPDADVVIGDNAFSYPTKVYCDYESDTAHRLSAARVPFIDPAPDTGHERLADCYLIYVSADDGTETLRLYGYKGQSAAIELDPTIASVDSEQFKLAESGNETTVELLAAKGSPEARIISDSGLGFVTDIDDDWYYCYNEDGDLGLWGYRGSDEIVTSVPEDASFLTAGSLGKTWREWLGSTYCEPVRVQLACTVGSRMEELVSGAGYAFRDPAATGLLIIAQGEDYTAYAYDGSDELLIIPVGVTKVGRLGTSGYIYDGSSRRLAHEALNTVREIEVSVGVRELGAYAFSDASILEKVTLPETPIIIENYAFLEDGALIEVTLGGATIIKESAFQNCTSLETVFIPASVDSIGINAFSGCSSLTEVIFNEGLKTIDEHAFFGCISLNAVILPEGLESIGSYAFYNCGSLTSLTIPGSVETVDGGTWGRIAFSNTNSLEELRFEEGIREIRGEYTLDYRGYNTHIYLPASLETVDRINAECVHAPIGSYAARYLSENGDPAAFYDMENSDLLYRYAEADGVERLELVSYTGGACDLVLDERIEYISTDTAEQIRNGGARIIADKDTNIAHVASRAGLNFVRPSVDDWEYRWVNEQLYAAKYTGVGTVVTELPADAAAMLNGALPGSTIFVCDHDTPIAQMVPAFFESETSPWELRWVGADLTIIGYYGPVTSDTVIDSVPNGVTAALETIFGPNENNVIRNNGVTFICDTDSVLIPAMSYSGISFLWVEDQAMRLYPSRDYVNDGYHLALREYTGTKAEVTIPEGVYWIEDNAFADQIDTTGYDEIDYRDNVTLEKVNFPTTLTGIGQSAFRHCAALKEAVLPEGVTQIYDYAFLHCAALERVELPGTVTFIGTNAFAGGQLREVVINEGVETLYGSSTFSVAMDGVIRLPDSLTYINGNLFTNGYIHCSRTSYAAVWASEPQHYNGFIDDDTPDWLLQWVDGKLYAAKYLGSDAVLTALPTGIDGVLSDALPGEAKLVLNRDSDDAKKAYVFYEAETSPWPLAWRDGELWIAGYTGTETMVREYPSGVSGVLYGAFNDVPYTTSFVCDPYSDIARTMSPRSFRDTADEGLSLIWTQNGMIADRYYGEAHELVIPEGVYKIEDYLNGFAEGNVLLEKVVLPSTIKCIGQRAFYYCAHLVDINLPEGLERIEDQAIQTASHLKITSVPSTLTYVGRGGFADQYDTTELYLPEGVTYIGKQAFYSDSKLEKLYIPGSVEVLGEEPNAIILEAYVLPSLMEVRLGEGITTININTVDIPDRCDIWLPDSLTEIKEQNELPGVIHASIGSYASHWACDNNGFFEDSAAPGFRYRYVMDDNGNEKLALTAYTGTEAFITLNADVIAIEGSVGDARIIADQNSGMAQLISAVCPEYVSGFTQDTTDEWDYCWKEGKLLLSAYHGSETYITALPANADGLLPEAKLNGLKFVCDPSSSLAHEVPCFYTDPASPWALGWVDGKLTLNAYTGTETFLSDLPEGIEAIDPDAFKGSTFVCDPADSTAECIITAGYDFFTDMSFEMKVTAGMTLWNYTGTDTEVTVPDGIEAIGGAFSYHYDLTKVTLPASVKRIEEGAFYNCYSLTEIGMCEGIEYIGSNAFNGCYNISEFRFPDSLIEIGSNIRSSGMQPLYLPDHMQSVGSQQNGGPIYVNAASETAQHMQDPFYDKVDGHTYQMIDGKLYLTKVNGYESVFTMSSAAVGFYNTDGIINGMNYKSIVLPAGFTEFAGSSDVPFITNCDSLITLTIPEGVTALPSKVAWSNANLRSAVIPSTVTTIASDAIDFLDIVYGFSGTEAEDFADEILAEFIDLNDPASVAETAVISEIGDMYLHTGEKVDIGDVIEILPVTGLTWQLTITTDNTDVISVNGAEIKAVGVGDAVVNVCITGHPTIEREFHVTVRHPVVDFELPDVIYVKLGEEILMTPESIIPAEGYDENFSWEIGNETVTGTSTFQYHAFEKGEYTLTVTSHNGIKKTTNIFVYDQLGNITISTEKKVLPVGGRTATTVRIRVDGITQTNIGHLYTFSSSDENVVTVSEDGIISAVGVGTTTVTATNLAGITAKPITMTVTEPTLFILPAAIKVIEEEAFEGTDVDRIVIPDGCTTIGSRAFANITAVRIAVPASVASIAEDAFENCPNLMLECPSGSFAEAFAVRHGIPFTAD